MDNFIARLTSLQKGRSVAAFARDIGIPQKTLDHLVKGERKPSVEVVLAVCRNENVSADWLLGLNPDGKAAVMASNSTVAVGGSAGGDCANCPLLKAAASVVASKHRGKSRTRLSND